MPELNRRTFVGASLATGLSTSLALGDDSVVKLGVLGTGGRGTSLSQSFAKISGVEVHAVCDTDASRMGMAAAALKKTTGLEPKQEADFRKVLEMKDLNAVVIASPNHWHAPMAILACKAGKHVYVEKPCSHNPREGEILVEVARKHQRHVQMGNQRRSFPAIQEACKAVQEGIIGRAYLAEAWYYNTRGSIGIGKLEPAPEGLDYKLWQGPAPEKPFKSNYLHYNWHWFWHWGNGELGNNGVHMLDTCRWGLGVDYPTAVTSSGGRYHFEDDQETPDTHSVAFEFEGRKQIRWYGFSCVVCPNGQQADVVFYGDKGSLAVRGGSYTVYDLKGKEIKKVAGKDGTAAHFENFIATIRGQATLNSEISEGHRTTLLCHLGNIAHRVGRRLKCDPKNGKILDDGEAMKLWSREYARGWEPTVS
ncbi:MAG: Gfo/Idh/MocA family oxidoreductase [Zavarzinella sp.]